MQTQMRFLNDRAMNQVSLLSYLSVDDPETNELRERMKKLLRTSIEHNLTDRQKSCIIKYYFEEKSVKTIAKELQLSCTTVYKHIHSGITNLKKCSHYL